MYFVKKYPTTAFFYKFPKFSTLKISNFKRSQKVSRFLDIVQEEATMDEDKLRALCSRKNIWDYFGIKKDTFLNLSEVKKMQLTKKFYFENIDFSTARGIDSSIGNALQNSSGINLTKITENDGMRTEMSFSTKASEKKPKSVSMWKDFVFLVVKFANLTSKKLICRKILYFISIRGINLIKIIKKFTTALSL